MAPARQVAYIRGRDLSPCAGEAKTPASGWSWAEQRVLPAGGGSTKAASCFVPMLSEGSLDPGGTGGAAGEAPLLELTLTLPHLQSPGCVDPWAQGGRGMLEQPRSCSKLIFSHSSSKFSPPPGSGLGGGWPQLFGKGQDKGHEVVCHPRPRWHGLLMGEGRINQGWAPLADERLHQAAYKLLHVMP